MKLTGLLVVCAGILTAATGCIAVKDVTVARPRYQAVSADGKLYVVDTYRRIAYPVIRKAADEPPATDDPADTDD